MGRAEHIIRRHAVEAGNEGHVQQAGRLYAGIAPVALEQHVDGDDEGAGMRALAEQREVADAPDICAFPPQA